MFLKNFLFSAIVTCSLLSAGCRSNTANNADTTSDSIPPPTFDTTDHSTDGLSADTYEGAMYAMMKKMKAAQMTGDFDVDFAKLMIEHSQGAIKLSDIELNTGKNDELREVARKIVDGRPDEVSQLQNFVQTYQGSGKKHGAGELQRSMSDMEHRLEGLTTTAYPDKDFVLVMRMHNDGAIDMAKKELANGMSDTLKKMAQKIVDESIREIRELEKFKK
ncbi:DUF305 domain-containing protein [Polluticoccus soli]|uniref:DUF305 domain-containing protein n=1 Tax=Polluticoccus soli TaxID=3034150 RepID=UPI0023E0FEE7|nr:DUF305 domain-containing protein [Flavipsychrobacter sp. JY13-12]